MSGFSFGQLSQYASVQATLALRPAFDLLYQDNTGFAAKTGDTNKSTIVTLPLNANDFIEDDVLFLYTHWDMTNNANTKTPRVEVGALIIHGPGISNNAQITLLTRLYNKTINTQRRPSTVSSSGLGTSSLALEADGAIDFAQAQSILLTAQLGNGADSLTLRSYSMGVQRASRAKYPAP